MKTMVLRIYLISRTYKKRLEIGIRENSGIVPSLTYYFHTCYWKPKKMLIVIFFNFLDIRWTRS